MRYVCESHRHSPPDQDAATRRGEDSEKYQVYEEHEALRIHLRADHLGDAEHDAAEERAPRGAEAADDHRLEGEDQLSRSCRGIERLTDCEKDAPEPADRDRDGSRLGIHGASVD